jgi:hypothetical protein
MFLTKKGGKSTLFPPIVSAETILFWKWKMWKFSYSFRIMAIFYFINWMFAAQTIEGGNLFKGGNYSQKYGMQSYEIKSPPWTILWFRILGIFFVENICSLGVFMFHTSDSSQLCIDSKYSNFSVADYCLKYETSNLPTYLYFQQSKGPPSKQA